MMQPVVINDRRESWRSTSVDDGLILVRLPVDTLVCVIQDRLGQSQTFALVVASAALGYVDHHYLSELSPR